MPDGTWNGDGEGMVGGPETPTSKEVGPWCDGGKGVMELVVCEGVDGASLRC